MEKFERDTMVSAKERNEAITKAMQDLSELKEIVQEKADVINIAKKLLQEYSMLPMTITPAFQEVTRTLGDARRMMGQFQETASKYHEVGKVFKDEIYSIRLAIDRISFQAEETTKTINKQINRIGIILSGIAFLGGMMFIVWLVQYLLQFIR